MILVTGAAGTTGRHLVLALRARGARVRALVRDLRTVPATWDDGVEPVVADMSDPRSLTAAADGVQAVYLLAPVGESMAAHERNVIDAAARSASKPRVVLHAAAGFMRHPDGVRFLAAHAAALSHLRAADLAWTALAPNGFFQNFLSMRAPLAAGVLPLPAGEAAVSYVDAADVAAAAAVVLTTGGHDEAVYTITGPAALTHAEIARQCAATLGHPVRYEALSAAQARDGFTAAAMDPWRSEGLIELYQLYASGAAARVSEDLPRLLGRPARSFRAFLAENAQQLA